MKRLSAFALLPVAALLLLGCTSRPAPRKAPVARRPPVTTPEPWEREVRARVAQKQQEGTQRELQEAAAPLWLRVTPASEEHGMIVVPIFGGVGVSGGGGGGGGTPPDPPTSFGAVHGGGETVTIGWADSANESSYELERSTDGGGYSLLTSPAENATGYTDTAALSGHTYQYRIRSANAGFTAFSDWEYSDPVAVP